MWTSIVFCVIGVALAQSAIIPKCSVNDESCIASAAKAAYPLLIAGDKSLGVESSDPLFVELIDGNLSVLKYKFMNTTVIGFKDCTLENIKFNLQQSKLHVDAVCPHFALAGDYEINGRLIVLPVEGQGKFKIDCKKYLLGVDAEIKSTKSEDGKSYLSIKNFKFTANPVDGLTFDFENLFNGQKDLSDAVHKFANENWKEVAKEVQEPVFRTNIKKVIKHVNKFLKAIPMDEFLA